ncbi:hydroxylysine kinase-like [Ostrea edulis]|uniref:hydroxylysine kinase-like n=1 Tax=Ostrea edulis TaxID=37623 RepID=UPI0024AF1842|nr:hydroxylysine kinase-like [Ostrea edulis]XP_048747693.2 hydroxylysine kinase-like [Ostrea edulis]XP_048747694.2 hydroxylysine kinase-like [Ostrea edulis]XP_048747696.2 hydroxylysine kinase-like [Ostrea edulis]
MSDMLQTAGETIKPFVPQKHLPHLIKTLYGLTVESCEELDSYDDRNYHVTVTDQSENPYISHPSPDGYVLKILNKMQSKNPLLVEAQHAMMAHIDKKGVPIPKLVKNLKGETTSLEKIYHSENITDSTPFHFYLVRLMTYIPGETFEGKATQPGSLYNIGKLVGRLHNSLEGFHHGFFDTYKYMWNLTEMEHLREFLGGVQDEKRRSLMVEIIDAFTKEVVPKYDKLTKGMIHGDLNECNILTHDSPGQDNVPQESRVCDVTALIDFNDVVLSYTVFDVAICIAYMSVKCKEIDQRDVGGYVLAGYLSERNLNSTEREIMKVCVCARIAQSLVMGAYTNYMDPSNTYVLNTAARGWPLLYLLWETPKPEIDARWNKIIEEYEY